MALESTGQRSFMLDDASDVWDELGRRVDALVDAWDAGGSPPRLLDYLPPGPEAVRRLVLYELLKVDLEIRWERGARWRLEDYVREIPEIGAPEALPVDLIYEEYHVRVQQQDPVLPEEFFARFPRQAAELARLLGIADPSATTTVCRSRAAIDVQPGQSLDDFDLLTLLGQGTFAKVFLARQRSLQRLVALKVSQERGTEPQTLAQLDHPCIVRVFDQRHLPALGLRLLYMEYVNGGTLQDVIASMRAGQHKPTSGSYLLECVDRFLLQGGQTPPGGGPGREFYSRASWEDAVCRLGSQLAMSLDYAHERGVLHRDVKPANVLLTADGQPKLADFNVSFCSQLDGITPAAFFGGSLAYMSPEQIEASNPLSERRPDALDARADIFSLGVLLWELLTGKRPFPDEVIPDNWPATLERLIDNRRRGIDPSEPRHVRNAELARVLRACLDPDPSRRPPTAGRLATRLRMCLYPRAVRLLRPDPRSMPARMARFPATSLILGGILPNLIVSLLNIRWNVFLVVLNKGVELQEFFQNRLLALVNGIAYAVGCTVLITIAWPVIRAVRAENGQSRLQERDMRASEGRALTVGDWIAWVSLAEWVAAGIAFPICLSLAARTNEVTWGDFAHFAGSHTLGGLVAASTSFFVVNFLVARSLLPRLLRRHVNIDHLESPIRMLLERTGRFVQMTVAVPPLALVAMAFVSSRNVPFEMLGLAGLAGSALALILSREIQRDLLALLRAFRAADAPPRGASSEVESLTL